MMTIPLELHVVIMEWVYRLSQYDGLDYNTLRACALVCNAWTPTAQRLLFRRVPRLHSMPNRLVCTAATLLPILHTHPHLAAHVRFVDLVLPPAAAADTASVALLELCTRVEGIILVKHLYSGAWDPDLEARLRAMPLQPVFFKVAGHHEPVGRAIEVWPSVRALVVNMWHSYGGGASSHPIHVPGGLRALSSHVDDIEWLLTPGSKLVALRELDLAVPTWTDARCRYLTASGVLPQLRVLTIVGDLCPPQNILGQLTRLEHLVVGELPAQDFDLPQSLRLLGSCRLFEAQFLVAALRVLRNMQRVTCMVEPSEDKRMAIECVCRDRGIEFEIDLGQPSIPVSLLWLPWALRVMARLAGPLGHWHRLDCFVD
ncbi:hypothetical protein FA95DRAFT_753661 [Auriscalpium vulgare]|uniref:Uncharacterized protein n=1 Tax=Auriscalpium vulgare TaxID=40419 RepID=A0ACB8SAR4_9AGAM|nr:hypothetical protein FA95DRAFT_753661 [Auriscalpium vulgare]